MDWKKLLPEGPFFLVALIGFFVSAYLLLSTDAGDAIAYHVFIAVSAFTGYRLYKKFKAV